MAKKEKQKRFTAEKIMTHELSAMVTEGMFRIVKKHTTNISMYVRELIMIDLKIDEYGKANGKT